MSTVPVSFGQFGQALACAERTMTAMLRRHLAERDTTPETWYALQLIALGGPAIARETLLADLERSRTLDAESTRELLARLDDEGLIRGDIELELTADGKALHASLREYVGGPTARLLSQFAVDDVETTICTLQAITARAEAEGSPTS